MSKIELIIQSFLFNETISNLGDWGKVFQNKEIFEPLAERILAEKAILSQRNLEFPEPMI